MQRLRQDWHKLVDDQKINGFYHLFEWYESYLEANLDDEGFLTLAVYSGDRLLALLPICETERRFLGLRIRVLEFPGTEAILHDAILAPGSKPTDIARTIRNDLSRASSIRWDFLRLNDIPGTSVFAERNSASPIPLSVVNHTGFSNIFELEQYRDLSKLLSKNFRANLRKHANKLRQNKDVSFETIKDLPRLVDAFYDFIELEASGWKSRIGKGRGAIKLNSKKTDFYARVMRSFSNSDGCHIHFLKVDERPIAGAFSILVNDTCFLLKIAYDEEFARLSPGNLLTEYIINYYLDNTDVRFINLISNSRWRRSWRPSKIKIFSCYVFNRTIKGLLCYTIIRIRSAFSTDPVE